MPADPLTAVLQLLAAIESRDLVAVADRLHPEARWANVPHPAAAGREAVIAMLAPILTWSDEVRWEVVQAAAADDVAIVERVDRFAIGGNEHAVACNGVFRIDPGSGTVVEVRDYVDLAPWRERIGPVQRALAERPAREVVERHLAAVARRDPVAMAADYALGAELIRGADRHQGWRAIAGYFASVPDRLAGRDLRFGPVEGRRTTADHRGVGHRGGGPAGGSRERPPDGAGRSDRDPTRRAQRRRLLSHRSPPGRCTWRAGLLGCGPPLVVSRLPTVG